jgi:hydroxymethylbilane synthase
VLAGLEAGCSAPIGALATVRAHGARMEMELVGSVTALDGSAAVRRAVTGPIAQPEATGRRLAAELLDAGASTMMETPA